jgi:hypothetical protein
MCAHCMSSTCVGCTCTHVLLCILSGRAGALGVVYTITRVPGWLASWLACWLLSTVRGRQAKGLL